MGSEFTDRIRRAVAEHAQRKAEEAANPELRKRREAERAADRERQRAEHDARQRAEFGEHMRRCGLPLRPLDEALVVDGMTAAGAARAPVATQKARAWWSGDVPLLLLCGSTGTGKTLACAAVMAQVRFDYLHPDYGRSWCWPSTLRECPMYVLAPELAAGQHFGADAEKRRDALTRCRLLVVDEIGAERVNDGWMSLFEMLIVRRHGAGLRTVLAGNVNGTDFRARYGERVARRLSQDGTCVSLGSKPLAAAVTPT